MAVSEDPPIETVTCCLLEASLKGPADLELFRHEIILEGRYNSGGKMIPAGARLKMLTIHCLKRNMLDNGRRELPSRQEL